jgi:ATP-binding cassette subfamily A (ABC1) protein 3
MRESDCPFSSSPIRGQPHSHTHSHKHTHSAGNDIRTNITAVQKSLGICPQHDVLFDTLTVEEHLWFFCKLKGVPSKEIKSHVDEMIDALELPDKRHAQSKTLSGGMKRKLSCAIALVGGSKVVILDEPTSGMDPAARRATWELLMKYKAGRTILLSTHFLDEADLLGDRIAIMSDGVVQCAGTSLFLKSKYGVGYNLVLVKKDRDSPRQPLEALVHLYVPDAKMVGNVSAFIWCGVVR